MFIRKQILILSILFIPFIGISQGNFNPYFAKTQKINTTGMYVLGGWAIANMGTGAVGWNRTIGSERYFHQMNFFWNTVNLGIAGFSFYAASQLTPLRMSPQEIMDTHIRYENLYLINAGLDIVYMSAGLLLKQRSTKSLKRPDMYKGYGNSILLQGGFLFLFDGVMYMLQHNHRMQFVKDMNVSFLQDGAILQYSYLF